MPTIPDIDIGETGGMSDTGFGVETDAFDAESSVIEEREEGEEETTTQTAAETHEEEEEESFFSDKNRWRRGGIIDPDADEW
jgi:hypothetical protein